MSYQNFKRAFAIAADTHNVEHHDAIMVVSSKTTNNADPAGITGAYHFQAEIFPYGKDAKLGAGGRPMGSHTITGEFGEPGTNYTAPTGDAILVSGNTYDSQPIIIPLQAKSIGKVLNADVFGLI